MKIQYGLALLFWALPTYAQSFTYEDLVSLIQTQNLSRIEDVLPQLPAEFRSHYTLMYQSRSLQGATVENPRVIMYGRDAKLACTFNGDESQGGFDTLECFQFRADSATFDFRQIQFPTKENGLTQVEYSASNQTANHVIQCSACHSADPRPNWDNYSFWPGAYGSQDDEVKLEAPQYAKFVARRANHPRYQWLIQGTATTDPYMSVKGGTYDIDHRPNLYFSEAVGRLNGLRDYRIMEERIGSLKSLMFAVSSLKCDFTDEQKQKFKKAGRDLDADLNLETIFDQLRIFPRDWTTQIGSDSPSRPKEPWDHQCGYTFLKEDIAMKAVQNLANQDVALKAGIDAIKRYFDKTYDEPELQFYHAMNDIILGLDMFGVGYYSNLNDVCPRLTEIFTEKYLAK